MSEAKTFEQVVDQLHASIGGGNDPTPTPPADPTPTPSADPTPKTTPTGDTTKPAATPDGPTPTDLPKTLRIRRFGRDIEMPTEEVINRAQKEFDYSEKMRELKAEREAIGIDEQAAKIGRELMGVAQRDPERARRIVEIANGQEPAPGTTATAEPDPDEAELTDTEKKLMRTFKSRTAQLEAEIGRLRGVATDLDNMKRAEAQSSLERQIETETRAFPNLWTTEDVPDVKLGVSVFLRANPNASVKEAVWAIATRDKDRMARLQQRLLDRTDKDKDLSTEPPGSGTPRATPPRKFTRKDLLSGNILNALLKEVPSRWRGK